MIVAPITMTWVFAEFTEHKATIYFPGAPFAASALLLLIALITFIKISPKAPT
jgi:DHA1 family tetracycline resistance protein-like MFS transporter